MRGWRRKEEREDRKEVDRREGGRRERTGREGGRMRGKEDEWGREENGGGKGLKCSSLFFLMCSLYSSSH